MPAPAPTLYETGTTTPLAPWDFGTATPSTESSTKAFDLANVGATAETLTEVSIGVLASSDGGATFDQDNPVCLERWVQVQAYDVDGTGIVAQVSSWTPVGVGARLSLRPIPADCRRLLRAKVVTPAGLVSSAVYQIEFVVYGREGYIPLPQGYAESGLQGVVGGTGDPTFSAILQGGALEATGTPDDNVNLTDVLAWKFRGVPHVRYPYAIPLTAAGAGDARWATLTAGAGPDLTVTQQTPEVAAPAAITGRPAAPADEELVGWVHRDDGDVDPSDLYTDSALLGCYGLRLDGLDATIGKGSAMVDNRLVRRDQSTPFTLADDEVTTFYVLTDGSPEAVVAGDSPAVARALPIWEVTVASAAVTRVRDLRTFLGPRVQTFAAHFAGPAVADTAAYWTAPRDRAVAVRIPHGAEISAGDIGGRTTGSLVVELEWWDTAWVSAFSDAAYLPALAFDADPPIAAGFLPDTVVFPAGTRFRWRIDTLPTGGSGDPEDVFVRVDFEELPT